MEAEKDRFGPRMRRPFDAFTLESTVQQDRIVDTPSSPGALFSAKSRSRKTSGERPKRLRTSRPETIWTWSPRFSVETLSDASHHGGRLGESCGAIRLATSSLAPDGSSW